MMRRVLILICVHGVLAWDMVLEGPKTVGIGQTLSLSCNATQLDSVPTDVEWFKGYDRLFPDTRISITSIKSPRAITGKLSVRNVTMNDGGKYKCWLSNEMIRHVVVTVAENPITDHAIDENITGALDRVQEPSTHAGKCVRKKTFKEWTEKDYLQRVLVGLRFLAKGSFYSELADLHGVSRSTVCRIVDSFIDAINNNLDNIRFQGNDLNEIKLGFYQTCGIPNVVGAVDGTMIPILAPSEDEHVYVCRKGFMDMVAKWPGSQHDAYIFDNSGLKRFLEDTNIGHLLGDSGYPLRPYVMTPLLHPRTEAEICYNNRHIEGRQVIEKAFGVLKSRFRCLHKSAGCMLVAPAKACRVVSACMRLHNFCQHRGIPLAELLEEMEEDDAPVPCLPDCDRSGADSGAARRQFPTAPSLIATLVLFALCLEAV